MSEQIIKTNLGNIIVSTGLNGVCIELAPLTADGDTTFLSSVTVNPDNHNELVVQFVQTKDEKLTRNAFSLPIGYFFKRYPRFLVTETSDAFDEPYVIKDILAESSERHKNDCYFYLDEVVQTFSEEEKEKAEAIAARLNTLNSIYYKAIEARKEIPFVSGEALLWLFKD